MSGVNKLDTKINTFAPKTDTSGVASRKPLVFTYGEAPVDTVSFSVQKPPEKSVSEQMKDELEKTKKEQGGIGKLWDGFKNLTGIGAGSNKAKDAVEKFKKGEITEEEARKALEGYQKGQEMVLDVAADIVSGVASIAPNCLSWLFPETLSNSSNSKVQVVIRFPRDSLDLRLLKTNSRNPHAAICGC